MSRMSGPKRKKVYGMLVCRDGEKCFIGHEPGDFNSLIVDHWDGNNSNNRSRNLHLLCRAMNSIKNPRGSIHKRNEILSSVSVNRPVIDGVIRPQMVRVQSMEMLKNLQSEALFRHWFFSQIVHCIELDLDEVVTCAAEYIPCSVTSVNRYIDKVSCKLGLYQIQLNQDTGKKLIRLKPIWESFRKRNEEMATLRMQVKNWRDKDVPSVPPRNIISL